NSHASTSRPTSRRACWFKFCPSGHYHLAPCRFFTRATASYLRAFGCSSIGPHNSLQPADVGHRRASAIMAASQQTEESQPVALSYWSSVLTPSWPMFADRGWCDPTALGGANAWT